MATTMHWLPKAAAPCLTSFGLLTAAVFTPTLSAPAFNIRRTSSTERIPPPTVSGIKTCSDTRWTTSTIVSLESELAVMSRKTNSSPPSRA